MTSTNLAIAAQEMNEVYNSYYGSGAVILGKQHFDQN